MTDQELYILLLQLLLLLLPLGLRSPAFDFPPYADTLLIRDGLL